MIFIHSLKNRYQSYVIMKLRSKGIRLFNQGEIYDAISVFLNAINICKPDDGIHFSDDQKDQLLLVIQVMGDAMVTKEAQIHAGIRCNYLFFIGYLS